MRRPKLCERCDNVDPKSVKVAMRMNLVPVVDFTKDGLPMMDLDGRVKFKLNPVHGFPLRLPHQIYYEVECTNCSHTFKSYDRKYLGTVIEKASDAQKTLPSDRKHETIVSNG